MAPRLTYDRPGRQKSEEPWMPLAPGLRFRAASGVDLTNLM